MSWRLTLAALGTLGLVIGLALVDANHVGVFHDDAMYVILAKSIATGQGYRWLNLPDAPFASHYPPGYPLVLALLWKLSPQFPANLALFKAFNALCLAACTMLVTQLAKETLGSTRAAVIVGILTAMAVPFLVLAGMVLSEPLFLAITLLVLLLANRFVTGPGRVLQAFGIGALIGAAMLVRSHGIVLAGAMILLLLYRRRWRDALAVALGAMVVLAPWQLWASLQDVRLDSALVGSYGSYAGWWLAGFRSMGVSMIPATLSRTTLEASAMLVTLFSPGRSALPHVVTLVALTAVAAAGALVLSRRSPVTVLFLAGYFLIVLIWPFPPSRFFWGVWPLLILLLVAGTQGALQRDRWPRLGRAAITLSGAWLLLGYTMYESRAVRGHWWSSIARAASPRIENTVRYAQAHSQASDVVAADDEGSVYLYTGRRTVPVSSFTTAHYLTDRPAAREAAEGLAPILARYPVSLVIVEGRTSFDAAQLLAAENNPILAPLESFPGGAAYAVRKR